MTPEVLNPDFLAYLASNTGSDCVHRCQLVKPVLGFETFQLGELIATDGPAALRVPCADYRIMAPKQLPIVGQEAVYLARPLH